MPTQTTTTTAAMTARRPPVRSRSGGNRSPQDLPRVEPERDVVSAIRSRDGTPTAASATLTNSAGIVYRRFEPMRNSSPLRPAPVYGVIA